MSAAPENRRADLARVTLGVLLIGGLLFTTFWIVRPFLGPLIWATMLVVASWPLMLRAQRLLWGKRALAVLVMTLALLLLFVVPVALAIVTIVDNVDRLTVWAQMARDFHVPAEPPAWLVKLPLVGDSIATAWVQGTSLGLRDLLPRLMPYADDATRWFVDQVGGFGLLMFQFLLTVVIAAVMYASGEFAATLARKTARRVGGERAVGAVDLAGGAIRGVALGVGVTALVQSLLGGLGLAVAGVPGAGLLTAVMFMLCIAQIGPFPVLLLAVVWVFWSGDATWGVVLAIWSLVVGTLDNVLRPVLIRMGADLPLLLIFAGVIGGLLSFGLVGIFVGPVILAVAYTLLVAWVDDAGPAPPDWRD
jgi:predicted PurR-regulated permease PerM